MAKRKKTVKRSRPAKRKGGKASKAARTKRSRGAVRKKGSARKSAKRTAPKRAAKKPASRKKTARASTRKSPAVAKSTQSKKAAPSFADRDMGTDEERMEDVAVRDEEEELEGELGAELEDEEAEEDFLDKDDVAGDDNEFRH
jgi:RNA polymerase primary sigma factor